MEPHVPFQYVSWTADIRLKVVWKCGMTTSGGPCVMIGEDSHIGQQFLFKLLTARGKLFVKQDHRQTVSFAIFCSADTYRDI